MNRPAARPSRPARSHPALSHTLALALAVSAAPLAAQQTFSLPPSSPSPTPAPAGPADERAGVAIPPRAVPRNAPTAAPSTAPTPVIQPLPSPSASRQPPLPIAAPRPTGGRTAGPAGNTTAPAPEAAAPAFPPPFAPGELSGGTSDYPGFVPKGAPQAAPAPTPAPPQSTFDDNAIPMQWPQWWPFAAGGLAALLLLGGGALLWRRRKPKALRLANPVTGVADSTASSADTAPPRLDLMLEIITASRSLMMFTVEYRLTIANRSERAVGDLNSALQLACARAGVAPSPGAAQGLSRIDRIGPHQARSLTGTVQLPLTAIAPLRQGQTPLFIPLAHVTLEGESLPAQVRTFVIGTPSPSGRVHPIALDVPPGGIPGLIAQAVTVPPASATASAAA